MKELFTIITNLSTGIKKGCILMSLRLKKRGVNDIKKVLIYGEDGSGKSTFAANYCKEKGLKPIVIDIDDTNYTDLPILDLSLGSDVKTYNAVKEAVQEISKIKEYDTIIIDGVSSLIELLVSKAKGLKKYSDRAERFNDILRLLQNSDKNLIFVGQIDMKVIMTEEHQTNKSIIKINSIVNEKYLTYKKKKGFSHKVIKYRALDETLETASTKSTESETSGFETADKIEPSDENPVVANYARTIAKKIAMQGDKITKRAMRAKCFELTQMGSIPPEMKEEIYEYINENCPGG